jgi:putative membrane protein
MLRKLIFAAVYFSSAAAVAAPARQFLSDAIKGDNSEISAGRYIAAHGASAQVRSFGRTLYRDHSAARGQAVAIARQMGVRPPAGTTPEARAEMRHLMRLHGRAFDMEVRRGMVEDHQADIAKFEAQVRMGDRRTATLARRQLPTLRKHLRIAESLRR